MVEVGISPSEALSLPFGDAISMVNHRRAVDLQRFRDEWERARQISFYSSQMLNQKGRSAADLFPFPWEGEQRETISPEEGMMVAMELQKRINKKDATTEASSSQARPR